MRAAAAGARPGPARRSGEGQQNYSLAFYNQQTKPISLENTIGIGREVTVNCGPSPRESDQIIHTMQQSDRNAQVFLYAQYLNIASYITECYVGSRLAAPVRSVCN